MKRVMCRKSILNRLVAIAVPALLCLGAAPPKVHRPNILLIVLDTVRYDAVNPVNTPFLASLGKRGIVWTRAYSTHDFTPLSHFSMMTGFRDGLGGNDDRPENGIAWQLRRSGYWTFATVANSLIGRQQMPTLRGFDDFKQIGDVSTGTILDTLSSFAEIDEQLALYHVGRTAHTRAMVYYSADRLLPIFLQQIRAAKRKPFFGFVNLVDAHEPYVPDPDDYPPERTLPPNFEGDVMHRRLGAELAHPDTISDPARRAYIEKKIKTVRFPRLVSTDLSGEALNIYHRRYNATIRQLDDVLHDFFDAAEKDHLLDDTVVIITSDHGESFGEKDFITHMLQDAGDDEATHHVPLIVVMPKDFPRKEATFDRRVSTASLAPTIYDFAGLDWSPFAAAFAGYPRSLAPFVTTVPPRVARAVPPPPEKQQLSNEAAEREKAMRALGYIQ
jgi:arylsulfatase A-like enzyme